MTPAWAPFLWLFRGRRIGTSAVVLLVCQGPVNVAADSLRDVTHLDQGIVSTLFYPSLGFDISDDATYWAMGAGSSSYNVSHRVFRSHLGRFMDDTARSYPSAYGQVGRYVSDTVFGDFDDDGFDDLLFVSYKHMTGAHIALFEPASRTFVETPEVNAGISRDRVVDRGLEYFEYLPGTNSSALDSRVRRAIALDLSGDGRDDIFVATSRGSNFMLESRHDQDPPRVTKFKLHLLDLPLPGPDQKVDRDTRAFAAWDVLGEGTKQIIAADHSAKNGTGEPADPYLHIYTYDGDACTCGNGICEIERASNAQPDWYREDNDGCPQDCGVEGVPEDCRRFLDELDGVSLGTTGAAAVGVVDVDGDSDADIVVFDRAPSPLDTASCYYCFEFGVCIDVHEEDGQCVIDGTGQAVAPVRNKTFRNDGAGVFVEVDSPPQLSNPYFFVTHAASDNFNSAQNDQPDMLVYSHLTPYVHPDGRWTNATLFRSVPDHPMQVADCPEIDRDLAIESKVVKIVVKDIDRDGALDAAIQHAEAQRVLYGTTDDAGTPDGCLEQRTVFPLAERRWTREVVLEDFNGDGRLDIFSANGIHTHPNRPEAHPLARRLEASNGLLIQQEDGTFRDRSGLLEGQNDFLISAEVFASGSAAAADLDGDLDADLVVANEDGPVFIYENRIRPEDGENGMILRQNWLPEYLANCEDACFRHRLVAADFDGNGTQDIAISSRKKGQNDILFNNIHDGRRACHQAVCNGARRLISAKEDLGIDSVFPVSEQAFDHDGDPQTPNRWRVVDHGHANQVRRLRAADMNGDGRPDLVVGANTYLNRGQGAAVFINRMRAWPQRRDQRAPNYLRPRDVDFDDRRTQWMWRVLLPPRGNDGRVLECLEVADLNADGAPDVFVATGVDDDAIADLVGERRLRSGCDRKKDGVVSYDRCHVVAICERDLCAGLENAGDPGFDAACCRIEPCQCDEGPGGARENCRCNLAPCAGADSDCEARYFSEVTESLNDGTNTRAHGLDAIHRAKYLVYVNNRDRVRPAFARLAIEFEDSDSLSGTATKGCGIGDFDGDGLNDIFVTSYTSGSPTRKAIVEARSYPELTASSLGNRIHAYRSASLMLLNPGWDEDSATFSGPFVVGPFPEDTGKTYTAVAADIDDEPRSEIILAGDRGLRLFDHLRDDKHSSRPKASGGGS